MAYQIQIRSDSATNWSNVNPILAQAEMGYETDTQQLKIGDGTTAWANLAYFASGGNGGGNYSNANVAAYLADTSGLVGNIIPAGNAVYSLGSNTNQWKDLWISNTTIYINQIPISLTSNNDLTVDGNPVVTTTGNGQTNVSALTVAGELGAANASITGNVVAGNYFVGDGGFLSNINIANVVGAYGDANVAAFLPTYTGVMTAGLFVGDGGGLSNINYGNVVGAYGDANVASLLGSGSLTTAIVTSGTITANSGAFAGNITANNVNSTHIVSAGSDVLAAGNVQTSGNVVGNNFSANGTISAAGNVSSGSNLVAALTVYSANVEATGNVYANYVQANTGSVTGNLAVAGNLSVAGNVTSTDVNNLNVDNALAYFGANNVGDLVDQGIITPFNNGTQQFGGWVRVHGTDEWVAFANVTTPPSNTVDFANATYSNIHVGYITGNISTASGLAQVAYSGSYTDLINPPVIPTHTSNLVNDSGFITANIPGSFHAGGTIVAGANLETSASVLAAANIGAGQNIEAIGNVTGAYILGNGAFLTGIAAGYSNADVAAYLPTYSGNIGDGAGYVLGNGAFLTGLPATYSNADVAAYLASNTITSNIGTTGYVFGNGAYLTGMFGNAEVANFLPVFGGNLAANIVTANGVNVNGDVQITGNLNVAGNTNTANTATLEVANAIIYAGANNTTDVLDQGLVTPWGVANVQHYTGIVRDHSTGYFRVFDTTVQPGTNIDWANTTGVAIQASTFIGDGGNLSNISYANVVGAYGDANVAAYLPLNTADIAAGNITVTEAATANIVTALGTVYTNDLSATGYASLTIANVSGNLNAGAVLTDNYLFANGTPVPFGGGSNYSNANVAAYLPTYTGNITAHDVTLTGNANVAGGASITGNVIAHDITAAGNVIAVGGVSATYFVGDGANLTNLPAGNYSNANVAGFLAALGSNVISTTGNITATAFVGNGALLTDLPAGYSNANTASFLAALGSNVVSTTGDITASHFVGNGALLTGLPASYSNANAAAFMVAMGANSISTTGTVTAANLIGEGSNISNIQWTNIPGANTGIADFLPTYTGDIAANNIALSGNVSAAGNVYGNLIQGNTISSAGNIDAAGNINVVGNLSYSNISTINVANNIIYVASNNVTNLMDIGLMGQWNDGVQQYGGLVRDHADGVWRLISNVVTQPDSTVDFANSIPAAFTAGVVTASNLAGEGGNISNINAANITGSFGNITAGNIAVGGNITANLFVGTFQGNVSGNLVVPGSNTQVLYNHNGNADASSGFTYDAATDTVVIANTLTTSNVVTGNVGITGQAQFSDVSNVFIPGGSAGQFLQTDGTGNLTFAAAGGSVTAIPAVYFTASVTGNNQTFANTTLAAYSANTDITLFYNGALLDSGFYTLSGDTITVNTPVETGDSISVSRQVAASATTIASNPYGNANVAAYLPTYGGNVSAASVTLSGLLQAPQTTISVSSQAGTPGQICWDGNFIYVCVAANTWKRATLSGF